MIENALKKEKKRKKLKEWGFDEQMTESALEINKKKQNLKRRKKEKSI